MGLLAPILLGWFALPAQVLRTDHGVASWILTAMAVGALGWSVRDALSAHAMGNPRPAGGAGSLIGWLQRFTTH